MFVASNHNYLLLFTEFGKMHWLRVYEKFRAGKQSLEKQYESSESPAWW